MRSSTRRPAPAWTRCWSTARWSWNAVASPRWTRTASTPAPGTPPSGSARRAPRRGPWPPSLRPMSPRPAAPRSPRRSTSRGTRRAPSNRCGSASVRRLDNLGDLLDPAADPAKTALIDLAEPSAPRQWSHGEIDQTAQAVARALVARGHRRDDRIAILAANRAEFLDAYLGTMRAGLVSVPVSFKLPRETVDFVLRDAGASLGFADAERRALCPADLPVVDLDGPGFDAFLDGGAFEAVRPAPGEIAMFLYTSGSTGRPKGVPLSHDGQLWAIRYRLERALDFERHRLMVAAPFFHMNALGTAKGVLAGHASMVLLPQFRAPAYIDAVATHRCTWLSGVPTMLALVARETDLLARSDLGSVERIGIGSSPLTQALIDTMTWIFPRADLTNGYGTTETGPIAFGPSHPRGIPRPAISLGYPIEDVRLRLVKDGDRDADEG